MICVVFLKTSWSAKRIRVEIWGKTDLVGVNWSNQIVIQKFIDNDLEIRAEIKNGLISIKIAAKM